MPDLVNLSVIKQHPAVRRLAVARHRLYRHLSWYADGVRYASGRAVEKLPFRIFSHKSVLMRKLGNADMRLQRNKVTNLRLAAKEIDGIFIRPGETFSLWKLVGQPTAKRGFVPGMLLSHGEVIEGVGGGLCQMANLLYWMALHSPLTVTERYRHSFDAFPDSGRVLPFGSGATIFYNYIDLQFRNDTDTTFQFHVWVDKKFLCGELYADHEPLNSYSIVERDHRFVKDGVSGKYFRKNVLFQKTINRHTGEVMKERLVCENNSEMKYSPPKEAIIFEM